MNDNQDWIRQRILEDNAGCGLVATLALVIAALAIFGGYAGARQIRGEKSYVGVGAIATSPTPKPTPSPTPEASRTPIVEERTTIIDRTARPATTQAPAPAAPAPYCPPGCTCEQIGGGWTQVCGGATNAPDTPAPTYHDPYGSPGH